MALKKFEKKQVVAVKEGKEFFKAIITTAYKDGRCKVNFVEDDSEGVYPNKDVFDFETWSKKRAEKSGKDSTKEPDVGAEKDKIDDFNIENLSETIDHDLDGILGSGSKSEEDNFDTNAEKAENVEKAEDVNFSDVSEKPSEKKAITDDDIFADTTKDDDNIFEQSPHVDILEGLSFKALVVLIKENKWHKTYTLNILSTDTPEVLIEKVRANVPSEELVPAMTDEDSVFNDEEKSNDAFDMGGGVSTDTKRPLDDTPSGMTKEEDIGDDWFTYGDHEDAKYKSFRRGTVRWWVPRGEKGNLTIITEKAFTYKEHRIRFEGQIYYITCKGGRGRRCLLCENKNRAYVAKAMYVIDHAEYFSKKHKKQMKNQVRLIVMKPPSYEPFRAVVSHHFDGMEVTTLRGVQITVQRSTGEKSPATGDIFFVNGILKKDIFKGEYDKTLADLQKELKPVPDEDIASKISMIETEPSFND